MQLQCSNDEFELLLQNRFELLRGLEDIDEMADEMTKGIKEIADKIKGPPSKKIEKISEATKDLLHKRRKMKKTGNKLVEYSQICKIIRSNMRKDLRVYTTKKIKETIEKNRSVNKLFRTMAP